MITALEVLAILLVCFGACASAVMLAVCVSENTSPHGERQPNGKPLTLWYVYRFCLASVIGSSPRALQAIAVALGLRARN
jgi:hypothetical protein